MNLKNKKTLNVSHGAKSKNNMFLQLRSDYKYPNNQPNKFTFKLDKSIQLDKNKSKISLKYLSTPPSKDNLPRYLIVHSDLVDSSNNNNSILKSLKYKNLSEYYFENPLNYNISKSQVDSIQIYITDDKNQLIDFLEGVTIVELEFSL